MNKLNSNIIFVVSYNTRIIIMILNKK